MIVLFRHAELVSAYMAPLHPDARPEWTLKQVQGDGFGVPGEIQ